MEITPYEEFIERVDRLSRMRGLPILRLQRGEWHELRDKIHTGDVLSIELVAITESRNKNFCGLYAVNYSFRDVKGFWTSYYIHWLNESEKIEMIERGDLEGRIEMIQKDKYYKIILITETGRINGGKVL